MSIQHGSDQSESPQSRCVLITRTIVDLKNYVEDVKAAEFAEILTNERTDLMEIDGTCSTKLSQLKTRTKGLIPSSSCLDYDVLWRYDDVIHPKLHAPYIDKLCTELHDTLKCLIDETVAKTNFDVEPEIFEEVLKHWLCCKEMSANFYGQSELVSKMRQYMSVKTNKPLVVYGEGGSGKSTLLSKLATEVIVHDLS